MKKVFSIMFAIVTLVTFAADFSAVKDKLAIVECGESAGSGFVLSLDGKKYLVTNKHVVYGKPQVSAVMLNGKTLRFKGFEVAANRDLVRLEVDDGCDALELDDAIPDIGDRIVIYGNSDGAGVATMLEGCVLGIGAESIEVDAKFVHGNSGSPVINSNGKVIGVATYAIRDANPDDWVKADSRFSEVRRFAVRLQNVVWQKVIYADFVRKCESEIRERQKRQGTLPQAEAKIVNPVVKLARGVIVGSFSVSFSGYSGTIKKPIMRMAVLLKSKSGEMHVRDCIFKEPWSAASTRGHIPIYAYGMKAGQRVYEAGNNIGVYYLEGISYFQRDLQVPKDKSLRRVEYLKNNELRLLGYCMDGSELIAFRIECWQNGSLSGKYDSRGIATLKAKRIPIDWYIIDKYPDKFNYELGNYMMTY